MFDALDAFLHAQHARVARHIHYDHLYPVASALQLFGHIGPISGLRLMGVDPVTTAVVSAAINAPSTYMNCAGLLGEIPEEGKHVDIELCRTTERALRTPYYIYGVWKVAGFLTAAASWAYSDTPLSLETIAFGANGLGYIATATAMFLKDQDPGKFDRSARHSPLEEQLLSTGHAYAPYLNGRRALCSYGEGSDCQRSP